MLDINNIIEILKQKTTQYELELFIYPQYEKENDSVQENKMVEPNICDKNMLHYKGINEILNLIKEKNLYDELIEIPDKYQYYEPVACILLKKNIVLPMVKESDEILHIIIDTDKECIYVCVSFSHPYLWYSVEESQQKEFDKIVTKIITIYNPGDYPDVYKNKIIGFMGSEKMLLMTKYDLIESIVIGEWNELFMWGPLWEDHPFRETFKNSLLSEFQYSKVNLFAMQQHNEEFTINIKTQISKSQITFISTDGLFYVQIKYDPVLLKNELDKINIITKRQYPTDLPIDVVQCLIDYPFVTHNGILKLRPLTSENFIIANILALGEANKINEIIVELQIIIDEFKNEDDKKYILWHVRCMSIMQLI
jgi:hypothetical protein